MDEFLKSKIVFVTMSIGRHSGKLTFCKELKVKEQIIDMSFNGVEVCDRDSTLKTDIIGVVDTLKHLSRNEYPLHLSVPHADVVLVCELNEQQSW